MGFGSSAQLLSGAVIKAADGTALVVDFANDSFGGTPNAKLELDTQTEGTVMVSFTGSSTPTPGVPYKLFNYVDAAVVDRVLVAEGFTKVYNEDTGVLSVKVSPIIHVWVGEGTTEQWTEAANWNTGRRPVAFDSVRFGGLGGFTSYDLAADVVLDATSYEAGIWTNDLQGAALRTRTLSVAANSGLVLVNPPAQNPLPTTYETVSVAGVLDLGGATQTISSRAVGDDSGLIRTGFELRNGKITLEIPSNSSASVNEWCWLANTRFTIGPGGHLLFPKQTDRRGEINFNNTNLKIDGGIFENLNQRYGAYIANSGNATIEVLNGGKFIHSNHNVILSYSSDGAANSDAFLLCDHGTVDLGTKILYMSRGRKGKSYCAMTNSTLICGAIGFSETAYASVGKQTLDFVDTTLTLANFAITSLNSESSVRFDGSTVVDRGGTNHVFQCIDVNGAEMPVYAVGAGGLTLAISDRETDIEDYVLDVPLVGDGALTLKPQGANAKSVLLEKGTSQLKGGIVLDPGAELQMRSPSTLVQGGGLNCKAGAKVAIMVGTTFGGAVALDGEVTFNVVNEQGVEEAFDLDEDLTPPVELISANGAITAPFLDQKWKDTRNRFFVVQSANGVNTLCYGYPEGMTLIIR